MPTRIQTLNIALGANKQTNISTLGTTFTHFDKLNATMTTPNIVFESDAAYIGKGGSVPEAPTFAAPVNFDVKNSVEKYGSIEFMNWALAYALGTSSVTSHVYTITPLDVRTALELPYFTVVEQLEEAGSAAVDNAYLGCAINDVSIDFNSGPGRQSVKTSVNWVGSGLVTTPSTVTIPGLLQDHYALASAMSMTINSEDYVAAKTIVSGSIKWSNNLNVKAGYYPGSGVQDNAAVMGRIEVGDRACSFEFTARLLSASTEYTKLVAGTTGTATVTFTYDGTHYVTFNFAKVQFTNVEYTTSDGLVTVKVVATPLYSSGLLSVTSECGIDTFGQ